MAETKLPLTGGCMCGQLRFEVAEPLLGAVFCHCKRCQRRSGAGVTTNALAAPGSFRVVSGKELVGSWDPADGGWIKSFCSVCGSQLFAASRENPDLLVLRMGALDDDPGIRPGAHQYVGSAPSWAPVPDDGLARFPERVDPGALISGS
jgi:hypothetical protein